MRANSHRLAATLRVLALGVSGTCLLSCSTARVAPPERTALIESTALGGAPIGFSPVELKPHQADLSPAELTGFSGPFAPSSNAPDHVMTWTERETGPLRWVAKIIRRHGAWFRVDRTDGRFKTVNHIHAPTGVTVTVSRNAGGPFTYFGIRAPDRDRSGATVEYPGSPTGDETNFAGELCRWWDVYRGTSDGRPTFRQQACVTPDGIAVADRTLGRDGEEWPSSAGFVEQLTRRSVGADEVRPTPFDREGWLKTVSLQAKPLLDRDFSVLLSTDDGRRQVIVRRRGHWTAEQDRQYDGSILINARADKQYLVLAHIAADGRPLLLSYRQHQMADGELTGPDRPVTSQAEEAVLGLRCRWFDTMVGVHDAGRHDCRTEDGIPLKIRMFARGGRTEMTATRLDRRPGRVEDLMPPEALSDLSTWGVPR